MGEIILRFNEETGETTIETKGFKGKKCIEETKFLKKALGVVTEEKKTAEYYQNSVKNENKIKKW